MVTIDESKIQRDTFTFLARKGHGALEMLAEASNLTTQSVRRVRQGTKVEMETLIKVQEGLTKLGWYDQPEPPIPQAPKLEEEPARYDSDTDVGLVLAFRLEAMARQLRNPHYTPAQKASDFLKFVENLADSLEAHITALKKQPNIPN